MAFRAMWAIGLVVLLLLAEGPFGTTASAAGTNDHFANRRQAAAIQQQQQRNQAFNSQWGGPTTGRNWGNQVRHHQYQITTPGAVIFAPGYYSPYRAYPQNFYGPSYYGPSYYGPGYWPSRQIYIERRIQLRR